MPLNILSIQSHVVYGHAGNAAAVFPLQRLGCEVWPLNTVNFSNHTQYGEWTGSVFSADDITSIVDGIEARGVLASCDAVLSGYMGDVTLGGVILDAVKRVRAANPKAVYLCDPVMGDVEGGCVVRPEIPPFLCAHAVPAADIVTPNPFELSELSGMRVGNIGDGVAAARKVIAMGPRIVVITSLEEDDGTSGEVEMLAITKDAAWRVATPRLPAERPFVGSGDMAAGVFLAHYLHGATVADALGRMAAAVFAVIDATHKAGEWELRLIAAQDEIVEPGRTFPVEKIAE